MTSAYTPTAEFTDSQLVVADGDAADHNAFNLGPEKAFNRLAMLRAATDGLLVWNGRARVDAGGTDDAALKVYCPPIEAVSVLEGTTWKALSIASETELNAVTHYGGGALAPSTVHYVYVSCTAGAPVLSVSLDAPGTDGIWKSGAVGSFRYLFSFAADASGIAIPMRRAHGRTTYRISAVGVTPLTGLSGGSATSFTNVDLSTLIPTTARVATLYTVCTNASTTAHGQAQFRTDGDTGGYIEQGVGVADAGNDYRGVQVFPLEVSSSRIIEYRRNNSSGYASITVSIYVLGYEE